ncbi:hypothetical protein PMAYCL1PPCAC_28850 [Pristionchus mayeri]|uniref:Mannosyltransferase n=1 Tax=Pristionchus mayeri TaxID=1317129 RepID=A0AAN5D9P4_9BILA|nr:hypothetical protein PMAYCL1PPCAC_28850 [Pristionchus mayeri]
MDDIYGSEWVVFISMLVQLILTPGTKVEESFNLQATHDLLYHGTNLSAYDHHEFPGVVPRTFAGPLVLATVASPLRAWQATMQPFNKMWMQLMVRGILGSLVVLSFLRFARAIQWYLGREVATNLRILVASQFHFSFYASRTLPNTFALVLVLYSISLWLEDDLKGAARWAIAATILFRFELVLLFFPLFAPSLLRGHIPLLSPLNQSAIWVAATTVLPLIVFFLPIDSLFWSRWPCWPEAEVIRFNVLDNRSHEYGTSPALWYFYSALPRALLGSIVFIPLSLIFDLRVFPLIAPALSFVAMYSVLPHKELRFIMYVIPVLSVPAAVVFARLYLNRHKSLFYRVSAWFFYALVASNLAANAVFTLAAVGNYPGGDALSWLQHSQRYDKARFRSVHIDVYAAQTGVSRFYESYPAWEYNKTEGLSPQDLTRFDFLIVGSDSEPLKALIDRDYPGHRPMVMIRGFSSLKYRLPKSFTDLLHPLALIPSIEMAERVVVLKKRDE